MVKSPHDPLRATKDRNHEEKTATARIETKDTCPCNACSASKHIDGEYASSSRRVRQQAGRSECRSFQRASSAPLTCVVPNKCRTWFASLGQWKRAAAAPSINTAHHIFMQQNWKRRAAPAPAARQPPLIVSLRLNKRMPGHKYIHGSRLLFLKFIVHGAHRYFFINHITNLFSLRTDVIFPSGSSYRCFLTMTNTATSLKIDAYQGLPSMLNRKTFHYIKKA